jgi:hypothetical protein
VAPLLFAGFLAALGFASGSVTAVAADCEEAKRTNAWCAAADAGYVASVEIRSRMLYEALDAHGHVIDPKGLTCEACRKARDTDGFCPAHRMGFVAGLAYLSPLTYQLARARVVDPAAITCPACREHTRGIGWCDEHGLGIAGRFALDDRASFETLREAHRILLLAVEVSARCETCAAAMVADGYCPAHRIQYRNGRAASSPARE